MHVGRESPYSSQRMPPEAFEVQVRTAHPVSMMFSHKREIEATESTPEAPEVWMGVGTPQAEAALWHPAAPQLRASSRSQCT